MSSSMIENLVHQSFDELYQQRLMKLLDVTLNDLFRNKNIYLLCATNNSSVPKIIEKMLTEYITLTDENIFGQTFLELIESIERGDTEVSIEKSQVAPEVITQINRMRNNLTYYRGEFDKEWAKALNRFEHDFLNNFGNSDGSIDWEKLLRYNSGKENVPWVSKVMLASIEDQVDDELDDNDDGIEGYE